RLRIDDLVLRVRNVIGYTPKGLNETFRSKTVRTRNYYTHFSSKSGKIFDSVEMYWASQRLAVVVIILALNQVGVVSSTIRKQLASRDDISRILRAPGVPF